MDTRIVIAPVGRVEASVLAHVCAAVTETFGRGDAIRLRLDYMHGFGSEHIEVLINERERRWFAPLADLIERTGRDRPHAV